MTAHPDSYPTDQHQRKPDQDLREFVDLNLHQYLRHQFQQQHKDYHLLGLSQFQILPQQPHHCHHQQKRLLQSHSGGYNSYLGQRVKY